MVIAIWFTKIRTRMGERQSALHALKHLNPSESSRIVVRKQVVWIWRNRRLKAFTKQSEAAHHIRNSYAQGQAFALDRYEHASPCYESLPICHEDQPEAPSQLFS